MARSHAGTHLLHPASAAQGANTAKETSVTSPYRFAEEVEAPPRKGGRVMRALEKFDLQAKRRLDAIAARKLTQLKFISDRGDARRWWWQRRGCCWRWVVWGWELETVGRQR